MCHICAHSCFHWVGFFQPDTNLFVYGHVEGWRREVWAVMLACQSVYTAVLKPPTLNVWKCLVFFIRWGLCTRSVDDAAAHIVLSSPLMRKLHARCELLSGEILWFFILHLSFLIFRASAWSWRAGITKVRLSASLPWIFEFAIKEIFGNGCHVWSFVI